jgi:hypothetical protein
MTAASATSARTDLEPLLLGGVTFSLCLSTLYALTRLTAVQRRLHAYGAIGPGPQVRSRRPGTAPANSPSSCTPPPLRGRGSLCTADALIAVKRCNESSGSAQVAASGQIRGHFPAMRRATLSIPSTAARSWSSTATPIGPASATVHRPKVAVQFVEAGTNRKQAVALSLNLGPDVWVGVGLGTVPAVLPLIGGGALWEGPGLGDDQAPARSSAVHEERVPHAGNSTALVRDAEASRSRTANRVRHPHFELMLLLLSSASQLWRTGRTLRHDPVREGERLCHPGRREPDCVHFREAGGREEQSRFPAGGRSRLLAGD